MNDCNAVNVTKCVMLWVDSAADLAALIWAGCRLAATVKRHGDGADRKKYCDNIGELEPTDLPGWIMFWLDDGGESELIALNRLGYRSAGLFCCDEIRDVEAEERLNEAAGGGQISDADEGPLDAVAAADEPLDAQEPLDEAAGTTLAAPEEPVHDDGWSLEEEEAAADKTAGCKMMGCMSFSSEMCCGSCSIM